MSSWTRDDYGKASLTIKLKNTESYRVQDIVVRITCTSKTGTIVGTRDHTIYEFINPAKTIETTVTEYPPKDAEKAGVIVMYSTRS